MFFESWMGILLILALLVALFTSVGYCRPHATEALETQRYSQHR